MSVARGWLERQAARTSGPRGSLTERTIARACLESTCRRTFLAACAHTLQTIQYTRATRAGVLKGSPRHVGLRAPPPPLGTPFQRARPGSTRRVPHSTPRLEIELEACAPLGAHSAAAAIATLIFK